MKKSYNKFIVILLVLSPVYAQWIEQNSYTIDNLVDVVNLDSVTALAIGDGNAVLRTTDAGQTWTNETIMLSALFRWRAISFSSQLEGVIVGDNAIWTTTDGGIKWQPRNVPSTQKLLSALQIDIPYILVGSDSGYVYTSRDTGNTWTPEKVSPWEIRSLFAWTGIYIWGLPIFALTPYSLCRSDLFPQGPWQEDTLEALMGLGSEAFNGDYCYGGGPGFIVGVQGDKRAAMTILRNQYIGGSQWLPVSSFSAPDGMLYGISAPSAEIIYTCGSQGTIFKSTDGGNSWTQMSTPATQNLRAISFRGETHGFAVGDSGTILYTSNGGGTEVKIRPEISSILMSLSPNYPNPFNGSTTIKYHLPETGDVRLSVFDLNGHLVEKLFSGRQSAGDYHYLWSGGNLPSGVYFLSLQAGDQRIIQKCMLMK